MLCYLCLRLVPANGKSGFTSVFQKLYIYESMQTHCGSSSVVLKSPKSNSAAAEFSLAQYCLSLVSQGLAKTEPSGTHHHRLWVTDRRVLRFHTSSRSRFIASSSRVVHVLCNRHEARVLHVVPSTRAAARGQRLSLLTNLAGTTARNFERDYLIYSLLHSVVFHSTLSATTWTICACPLRQTLHSSGAQNWEHALGKLGTDIVLHRPSSHEPTCR